MKNCKLCHECGAELREVLDGEEWCDKCKEYKRYASHGWKGGTGGAGCVTDPFLEALVSKWAEIIRNDTVWSDTPYSLHGSPESWANSLPKPEGMTFQQHQEWLGALGEKLVKIGAIKPDYRKHKGFKADGRTYRLSRGWFNKHQKEVQ